MRHPPAKAPAGDFPLSYIVRLCHPPTHDMRNGTSALHPGLAEMAIRHPHVIHEKMDRIPRVPRNFVNFDRERTA
ncbi:hypothetical protein [Sphingomonas sp.]|uniref:hypothetical protein n=1 Tax=Sphingomonas sp. TaxID=28214 RepID=UPI0031DB66DC